MKMEEGTKKKKGFFSSLMGKIDKKMEEKANCSCGCSCCGESSASKGDANVGDKEGGKKSGRCC